MTLFWECGDMSPLYSADMSAHSKAGAKSFDFSAIGLLWKAFCQTVSRLRN